jgi:hypothetical protein
VGTKKTHCFLFHPRFIRHVARLAGPSN